MKFKYITLFLSIIFLFSCQDEDAIREKERLKNAQKSELIFEKINKDWNFKVTPSTPEVASVLKNWSQWKNLNKNQSHPSMPFAKKQ